MKKNLTRKRGHLVVIGGAEDRKEDKVILSAVAELAGGADGRMIVLTTASRQADERPEVAEEFKEMYEQAFADCGLREIRTLHIHDRPGANDPALAEAIAGATGVFMTGGDQIRLMSILGGTAVHRAMRHAFLQGGACISGTSAGASALSEHMAAGGPSEVLPKKGMLPLAAGLGFLRHVVLDQHFSQRRRLARLLSVVAQNPSLLGIGIDEDTALLIAPGDRVEVLGSGAVTMLDGRDILYTNFNEVGRGETLALTDVRLHLLPAGFRLELGEQAERGPQAASNLRDVVELVAADH